MEDKLQILYNNLIKDNYDLPDFNTFKSDMSDPIKSKKLHETLLGDNYELPDYDTFTTDLGLKKKDFSLQGSLTPASGKEEMPFLDALGKPLTPQQPLPSAEKPRETTVIGDLARTLKSTSSRALGGVMETPMLISNTVHSLVSKPIIKAMGGTDEDAQQFADYTRSLNTFGQTVQAGEDSQKILNKEASKTEAKMQAIEGNIAQNIQQGKWGDAAELLGRGVVGSIPYLAMTAATAGGGTAAVLGTIGATSAAQQYGEIEGVAEPKRLLNSWMYGGFEAAGELVTAGLLRGVGKSFKQGIAKEVNPEAAKGFAKGLLKSFGLESSSEAVTQVGQNFTDIVTGVDPKRNIFDGVLDAAMIGGISGGGIGAVNIAASMLGRAMASPKEEQQVQNNAVQQKVLIDQIEQTDSDPVKNALKRSIKDLRVQADEVMDANYELATKLSPEKQAQVAELYSVWNELQSKIDNKEVTEQEIPALEKTIKGFKDQIQAIKDEQIAIEEAKAKEAEGAKPKEEAPKVEPTKEVPEPPIGQVEAPQKAPYVEINSENISEIENNELTSLREQGVDEAEIADTQNNIDLIKQSVNERAERERNPLAVPTEDRTGEISVIRPEEIAGDEGALGSIFRGRRDGNRAEGRITPEEQVKNTLAPNGKKSNLSPDLHSYVRTPEFIQKFGNWQEGEGSLVLDRNGEPLLVYSGKGKYHTRGLDPTKTQQKILFFTGDRMLAKDYAQFGGKQPTIYRGFVRIGDTDLQEGSQINNLHEGQQEFIITKKDQFIPTGVEEVPKLKKQKKVKPAQSKDTTKELVTDKKVESLPLAGEGTYLNLEEQKAIIEEFTHYKSGGKLLPRTKWADWFLGRSRKSKEGIREEIEANPKLKTALLSSFYDEYVKQTGENISYEEFLNKDIPVFRGETEGDVKAGKPSGFQSYTLTKDEAKAFSTTGNIEETTIKPKDSLGLIQSVGAEREILIPTEYSAEHYEKAFNKLADENMQVFENLSKDSQLSKLLDENNYKDALTELNRLITSKEAITAPIEEKQGEVPPPPQKPVKEAENAPEEKQREKGYYKRLNESSVPSEDLKDEIKEKGLTYTVLNNNVTKANVDYLISELGLEEAWKQTKDKNSALNGASRSGISERLVVHYDKLATEAEKDGNLEDEKLYREKALEIAEWKDEYGRDAGQFNQYSGSDESTALLSPKSNVVRVKKSITKQRNKKIQQSKTDIKEKRDAMRDANKESVNDVISSKQYEDLKKRIAELERKIAEKNLEKPPKTTPTEKIKSEKEFRAKRWQDFKDAGKKSMSASILGLNSEQIEALGDILASYIKEGAFRTEDIVKRFKKEFFKNTGRVITDEDVMALMPKKIGDKTTDEVLAENENKALSDKLVERVKRLLEDPKTPKNDPAKQLIDTLFAKIEEKDTKEKVKPPKKSDVEKIREAIENKEQYAQTWEEAKEKVLFMIETNEDLTEEQKSDQKKRLQSFFDEVIGKPFAEKQVTGAIKEKIKELGVELDKVVKQHYTVQDATGRTLAEKLVDELGLDGKTAEEFAKEVQKQFDKIATERKKKILLRGITARARALTNPKQAKLEWEKLIELTNLGAFSSAEFSDAYADIWGFPKLTEEQTREIERLAGIIQQKEGFKKDEAVRDYLNYLANLPGIDLGEVAMGWWYASILSGQRTQAKNFLGNLVNTIFEAAIGTVYNVGKGDFKTAQAMWSGLLNAGTEAWTEAKYTFATGYSPVRFNKIEAAQTLERWTMKGGWKNPINYAKYVGRFMSATDAFFYIGLREMRAHELAMREAKKINAEAFRPTTEDWAKAEEILFGTTLRKAQAELQAKDEGLTGTAFKKRVFELMEKSRGEGIVTESNNFASRGTYNYRPEGGIGMITEAISRVAESGKVPIINPFTGKKYTVTYGKFIVPFTRIIANVANTSLDYTPIGAVRAFKGSIKTGREERREYTSEEKSKLLIKATIGTATAALLYLLSEPPDDENKESVIQITANGTGDYAKNQELKGTPNGWQQYSIKVGDTWYSYQYTPLFLVLAPMGFLRDTQKYKKDKALEMKALDIFAALLSVSMSSLSDITALTAVSDLMGAISSGDLSEFQRFWKKMASSTAKGFIYPKAVEQSKQMIADFNDSPNTYSSSFLGKMVKDMPGMKNYFPVQFNQFGEPVTFDAVQMIEKPTTTDPVAKYVADNDAFIGVPDQRGDFCVIYDDKLGVERGMNDNEYMLFVQTSGREIKNRIMDELMPRTDLTPEEIKKEIANIKSAVRKQTKAVLFGWNNTRKNYPLDWNKMVETSAVPVPAEMVEVEVDDKKVRLDEKQLDEFNEKAIDYYRQYVMEYLRDAEAVKADKSEIDEETGSSYFNGFIKKDWTDAKADAKADFEEKLNKK